MKNSLSNKEKLRALNRSPSEFDGYEFRWIDKCTVNDVLSIRNAPHVVKQMAEPREISADEHLRFLEAYDQLSRMDFVLFDKENDISVGCFSLVDGQYGVEIGKYIGHVQYLGKGLGTRATSHLLEFCRSDLNLDRVFSRTRVSNDRNIKVNRELGFTDSEFKDDTFLIMEKLFS